jgi:NAD-dependent SIR2 family protein deacetylase
VQAGIPDFRSPEGLFQTVKKANPKEALASGKDLFDASVFNVSILFQNCCQRRTATSIAHQQLPIV